SSVCLNGSSQLNVNASSTLGYQVNTVPFVPIASGTGTITLASAGTAVTALTSGSLDDGYWNGLTLPFPFTYYGTSYTTFNVQTNGIISLSAFTTTTGYSSSPQMPNAAVPNNILGVFGDMEWRFGGVISCYTSGSAPNRIFVINYDGTTGGGFYNSGVAPTALVTYQIQLFENGNKIQFHTTSITTDASHNHTMGIENLGGTAATVIPGRDNSLWSLSNDGTEIALTPLTYLWSPSTFLNNSTIANPLASNVTATTVYNVTVTQGNGCSRSGTVTLTLLPQPTTFTVTGGGGYCAGGSGVLVGLSGSESGVNYQLQLNSVNIGSPLPGTGAAISFG
ncbi:MAG TPA: hypothetical protein VJ508_05585, partial [Saprospiraceae bacterium]|nr:hypothetical protein [Saprospiraceae bacterium]